MVIGIITKLATAITKINTSLPYSVKLDFKSYEKSFTSSKTNFYANGILELVF